MHKSSQEILSLYLEMVAEDKAFPLQNHVQKASDAHENTRYHLQKLLKAGVLERNETKQIVPGPQFIPCLHSLGILDKWLLSEGAPLLLNQLGGVCRTTGQTRLGVVSEVKEEEAIVVWLGEDSRPCRIPRKTLRRIWPVRVGDRIYATQYTTKTQGFVKCRQQDQR